MRRLRKLHADLVGRGLLTEAEFWQGADARKALQEEAHAASHKQSAGLSTAMVERQLVSSDQITLTREMLQQILIERPAVQRALLAYIPSALK